MRIAMPISAPGRFAGRDGSCRTIIKTGYTVEAGFNLAASAKRGNRRLIAVVLGERTARSRDRLVAQILERGFNGGEGAPS
jgi:D-alanyl-D-alanine carboxypeptidase